MTYPIDFAQLKRQVPIREVLKIHGLLDRMRHRGDEISGTCPLHNGTNPVSFRVSVSKNCYHCFSCGEKGNAIELLAALENLSFVEAAQLAHRRFIDGTSPAPLPPPPPRRSNEPNQRLSFRLPLDPKHPYLRARGLTPDTIRTFGLGYCSRGIQQGRIAIPIHNIHGQIVAYAGRWPGDPPEGTPKYLLPDKNHFRAHLEVFNLHRALAHDAPLILVEGYFDVMAIHQAGFPFAVAAMGNELTPEQAEALVAARPSLIVFFDPDDAGRAGAAKTFQQLGSRAWIRRIDAPAEPADLPPEALRSILEDIGLMPLVPADEDSA